MHDVFISYSTKDMTQAETIRDVLEKNGIPCWMAPRDIPGGSNYAREIPVAIRACQVFVLVMSENAQASNWVVKELDNAVNCGKIIIPLMLEDCPLNDEFNFLLTGAQRYAAYQKSAEVLNTLVERIKAVTKPKEEVPAPQTTATAAPKTPAVLKKNLTPPKAPAVPVVRQAKPQKTKPEKPSVPFVFGRTELLAALAIPGLSLITVLGYLMGNSLYFSNAYPLSYHFGDIRLYAQDYKLITIYAVIGALIGGLIWWEWIRFRHGEQAIPPACPSCGSIRMKVNTFRTGRMTWKEKLTLIQVPVWAIGGTLAQFVVLGMLLPEFFGIDPFGVSWTLPGMLGAGCMQGVALGLWFANVLVRRFRSNLGLCSTACRCLDCRATFLPVKKK